MYRRRGEGCDETPDPRCDETRAAVRTKKAKKGGGKGDKGYDNSISEYQYYQGIFYVVLVC